jgi:Flp pilus assembly secretin CpaC
MRPSRVASSAGTAFVMGFSMLSRIVLAVVLALAFGASPARPETSDVIAVTLDQAKIAKLPKGATTVIIGNPMIADVTLLKASGVMVVTGKGYGQTNMIAINNEGQVLEEKQIRVAPPTTVLVLQRGDSRVSYSCNPACMPTVQLGDDNDLFSKEGSQITTRNGLAQGGVSAGASDTGK